MPHNASVVEEFEHAFVFGMPKKRDDMLLHVSDLFLITPADKAYDSEIVRQ